VGMAVGADVGTAVGSDVTFVHVCSTCGEKHPPEQ
jgi:hypothetical protein